ncbi:MAG: hypothetical protein J6023_00450 [Clostridia bacterium]|nr:hypothetical protein [Clostridia bacterium]
MRVQKKPDKISDNKMMAWGTGLIISSVLVSMAYFFFKDGKTSDIILIFVAAGTLLALGLLMFISVFTVRAMRKRDERKHLETSYFLYDFKNKKRLEMGELTAEFVAEHVAMMIAMHRKSTSVFMEDLFSDDSDFEEIDKPLIAWFLLYYWIVRNDSDMFEELMHWDEGFARVFLSYLTSDPQDEDAARLAQDILEKTSDPSGKASELHRFLDSRKLLIEDRMLNYVLSHLQELHWDPYA